MTLRNNTVLYAAFEIFFCMFVFITSDAIGTEANLILNETFLGVCTLINLILFLYRLKRERNELFSIASLFVIFMYLFNLGLPVSRLLGWIDESGSAFMNRRIYSMGEDTFIQYMIYAFCLISMLQVGVLHYFSNSSVKRYKICDLKRKDYDFLLMRCRKIGSICIVVGILPYFYGEYAYIKNALAYGYQNADSTFNMSGTGIGLIGNLFVLGIMMCMLSFQKNKLRFDFLFVMMSAYQVMRMYVTGDRSTGIALILVWLLIRHKFVAPIKGTKALIFIGLAYIGMLFIKLVELTRSINGSEASEVIHELVQSNILAETVFEYGGNSWCGMMVYYSVPSTGSFRFGLTYIAAIIGKPLSLLGITNDVWTFADFSYFLQESARGSLINNLTAAMGGSFSGEWYFNFGWLGILLIPIFGYFLAKFSDLCVNKTNNPVLSGYLLYIATLVIWWVRQYFTSVSWNALFYGVIIFILYSFINSRSK